MAKKKVQKHFLDKIQSLSMRAKILIAFAAVGIAGIGCGIIIVTSEMTNRENINGLASQEIVQEIVETEEIPFERKEREDTTLEKGVTKLAQEGVVGEKSIRYRVVLDQDGNEISKEKIGEEVTKEPLNEIILIGTREEEPVVAPATTPAENQASVTPAVEGKDKCKNVPMSGGRPEDCPLQTREEFTDVGGWECLIWSCPGRGNSHGYYFTDGPGVICETECYGVITLDQKTFTVYDTTWDDRNPRNWYNPALKENCNVLRNSHPIMPSIEYLTNFYHRLVSDGAFATEWRDHCTGKKYN